MYTQFDGAVPPVCTSLVLFHSLRRTAPCFSGPSGQALSSDGLSLAGAVASSCHEHVSPICRTQLCKLLQYRIVLREGQRNNTCSSAVLRLLLGHYCYVGNIVATVELSFMRSLLEVQNGD